MPVRDRRITGVDVPDYRISGVGTITETAYSGPWPNRILAVNFNLVAASLAADSILTRSSLTSLTFQEVSTASNKILTKSVSKDFVIIGQDVQ